MYNVYTLIAFFFLLSLIQLSCTTSKKSTTTLVSIDSTIPAYHNLQYWAAHPLKKNTSDSLPRQLREGFTKDTSVDVFFIHPTTYTSKEKEMGWNASINNETINTKTDNSSILYQASIFNAVGNVYAPRYRQANYYAYLPVTSADTLQALQAFDIAYQDIAAAFNYYVKNYNRGKPFIIAAHSQGTTHALRLIKEFVNNKPLQEKLIVAYLVGMPVKVNEFSNIAACTTANQINCFCSWRTFKENYISAYVAQEKYTAAVTNPLSWNATDTVVSRFKNEGSILKNFNKVVKKVTGAINHTNILWAQHPKFFGSFLLRTKNYHIADYNFYYLSIRKNAALRAAAFKLKNRIH